MTESEKSALSAPVLQIDKTLQKMKHLETNGTGNVDTRIQLLNILTHYTQLLKDTIDIK